MMRSIDQRLVASFVERMLLYSGYLIYRIDYEKEIQKLMEAKRIENYEPYLKDLKDHGYDFLLRTRTNTYFVRIKFCKKPFLDNSERFNQGEIIFVTPKEPVFHIANVRKFIESGKTIPLNKFLKIDEDLLKNYKRIIKTKFL